MGRKKRKRRIRSDAVETSVPVGNCEEEKSCRLIWVALLVIACAGILAYSNSFGGPFIFDDVLNVIENPSIRSLSPIWDAFRPPMKTSVSGRPLINFTFALNYAVSRHDVWSYHVLNLLIHILGAWTLFGIVRRTFLSERLRERYGDVSVWLALSCSLLWILHPLQIGAVTYITQRCESLMGLLFLLTVYAAIRGWQSSTHRAYWHAASIGFCLLGTGAKEVIAAVPLTVLAYDWVFVHPNEGMGKMLRRSWWLYAGLIAALIPLALLVSAGGTSESVGKPFLSPWAYALTQSEVILYYIRLTFYPAPLCLDYVWPAVGWEAFPCAAIVLAVLAVTGRALWKRRPWGYPAAWFFAVLAPTSSFLPLTDPAVEYRMYLSLAGISVLATVGGYELSHRIAQRCRWSLFQITGVLSIVSIILLGALTYHRNIAYQSALSIWSDTVRKQPENPRGHYNLAQVLMQNDLPRNAIPHFQFVLKANPNKAGAYHNLGSAFYQIDNPTAAIPLFQEALKRNPDHAKTHNNLALALDRMGKHQQAFPHYQAARQLNPDNVDVDVNLGAAMMQAGKPLEAANHYRKALKRMPGNAELHYNLGCALHQSGKPGEAVNCFHKALRLNPDYAVAHYNLGMLLFQAEKPKEAISHFEQAIESKPDYAEAHNNLGSVLYLSGNIQEAITHYREALKIDPNLEDARVNLEHLLQESAK